MSFSYNIAGQVAGAVAPGADTSLALFNAFLKKETSNPGTFPNRSCLLQLCRIIYTDQGENAKLYPQFAEQAATQNLTYSPECLYQLIQKIH